eukprot:11166987-Heterocapsa_arctica.AAC.1
MSASTRLSAQLMSGPGQPRIPDTQTPASAPLGSRVATDNSQATSAANKASRAAFAARLAASPAAKASASSRLLFSPRVAVSYSRSRSDEELAACSPDE